MSLVEISIFTPTYNRAGILKACYDSLLKQTSKNFVWIIVDDGSTDETGALIKEWQKGDSISILYLKQGNSGKHVAHNNAVKVCTTPYILILDSDDTLTPDCIETLYRYLPKLSSDGISGIIGNRYKNSDGKCHGPIMPSGLEYASGIELYQTYGVTGDTLRLYKTSILREFLFPVIDGEKFIYENVVFDAIDEKYSMLIIHDTLYYCEYLNDGYTFNSSSIKVNNPIGYSMSLNSSVKNSINLKKRANWTILYIIWCKKYGIQNCYKNFGKKGLYISLIPAAAILFIFKKPSFFFMIMEYGDTK